MAAPGAYEPQSAPISAGDHEECGWKRGGGLESGTDVTKATWRRMKCGGLDGAGLLMEETSGCLFPLFFGPTGVNPLEDERPSTRASASKPRARRTRHLAVPPSPTTARCAPSGASREREPLRVAQTATAGVTRRATRSAASPKDKRGVHRYALSNFGLDAGSTHQRFDGYCVECGVARAAAA